jgi:hypothetical protein
VDQKRAQLEEKQRQEEAQAAANAELQRERDRKKLLPAAGAAGSSQAMPSTSVVESGQPGPFYTRWWFWTGVTVVAAASVTAVLLTRSPKLPASGTLPTIDAR